MTDDFELGPYEEPPQGGSPRPRGIPGGVFAAVAILAVGVAAVVFLTLKGRRAPRPSPSPAPTAEATASPSEAPSPSPSPVKLPPVDASDPFVRSLLKGLSSDSRFAAWLEAPHLVRIFVVVVENVAEGPAPTPHLRFLEPKDAFRVSMQGNRYSIDPRSYARYDAFGDVVASLDAKSCAGVYRTVAPLVDRAYRDLGHPAGAFEATLARALGALLAVPVLDGEVALTPKGTVFAYADRKLEALTPAQKQFLRTGPRNIRLVQAKLRELAAELGVRPAA